MTQSPANKFRKSASGLQKQIDHKRSPRLTNTAKRMREWESAIQDALHMELLQDKLNALADAWDNITLPLELSTIKDMAQVECLLTLERAPINPNTDSYKRMERAELLDPDKYTVARNALLALGNNKAGQEDKSIQLKRAEMDVDNSRIVGYFPTPDAVIRTMLEQVEIEIHHGDHILEPSAGKGSIADVLRREYPDAVLHCVEWNYDLRKLLELKEHTVICDDIFDGNLMEYYHHQYKLIVMNPPWGKEYGAAEDARHILHCYEHFLADDGQLISVVSASAAFNQNKDYAKFREFVDERGYFVDVPQGAFKNADRSTGTSVKIVVLDKRSDAQYAPEKPVHIEDTESITEPAGISEAIVRDLEEAIDLMKQIHEVNEREATDAWVKAVNDKARQLDAITIANRHKSNEAHYVLTSASDEQLVNVRWDGAEKEYRDLHNEYKELAKVDPVEWHQSQEYLQVIHLNQRVFVPHCNEAGTIRKIGDNGFGVDVMLESGQYLQTHRGFIKPSSTEILYKEETPKSPLSQVQDSPVDEKPKMRQLKMF